MASVENNGDNMNKCNCGNCPSYTNCNTEYNEGLFCSTGASRCEMADNGCVCKACLIFKENELNGWSYCIKGSADQIG